MGCGRAPRGRLAEGPAGRAEAALPERAGILATRSASRSGRRPAERPAAGCRRLAPSPLSRRERGRGADWRVVSGTATTGSGVPLAGAPGFRSHLARRTDPKPTFAPVLKSPRSSKSLSRQTSLRSCPPGVIEYTLPDRPRSRLQKSRLAPKGRNALKNLDRQAA